MPRFWRILVLLAATATIGVCQLPNNSSANERAAYWRTQGYNFDPSYMSPSMMDYKVRDYQRATYWKTLGYNFDATYMSASMMDYKVRDYQRAAYWKTLGYNFDATYMSASMMDYKVRDYQRAAYWKTQGYNFDASYMSASMMDYKVKDIQRAAYWKAQGYSFDSSYMSASIMDYEVRNSQRPVAPQQQHTASSYTPPARSYAAFSPQMTPPPRTATSIKPLPVASASAPVIRYSYPVTPLPSSKPAYVPASTGDRYYDYNYRPAVGDHSVSGYVRRDGTYVAAHRKTDSDDSYWNNWSSSGNLNPYTGKIGTKLPTLSSGGGGYVSGYMKSNGTYVSGHFRKSR